MTNVILHSFICALPIKIVKIMPLASVIKIVFNCEKFIDLLVVNILKVPALLMVTC